MNHRPARKIDSRPRKAKPRSRQSRPTYRHGRLRETLLEESLRLMGERDDASFTLREVAQRIGVSHSAAYRHYSSKGALLADIAQRGFELLANGLSQALVAGKTPEEAARLQARAYVRMALEHPAHFRCMFGPRRFSEEEGRQVDEAGDKAFACLAEAARRLGKDDAGPIEGQNGILAMWSMVHGLAHLAIDQQLGKLAGKSENPCYEEMADSVTSALLGGLDNRKAK